MTPKKPKNIGYALIFWYREKLSDIVELSCIPPTGRKPDSSVLLTWEDHITGEITKEKAKVIAINAKKAVLEKINIDENGSIVEPHHKIFAKNIINKKREMDSIKKKKQINTAQCKKNRGIDISRQKSLMDIAFDKLKTADANVKVSSALPLRRSPRISPRPSYGEQMHDLDDQEAQPCPSTGINEPPVSDLSIDGSDSSMSDEPGLIIGPTEEHRDLFPLVFDPDEVTKRDIHFQRKLLASMEKTYLMKRGKSVKSEDFQVFEIPDKFTQPGKDKVEIAPGSGIYFPEYKKYIMESNAMDVSTGLFDWIEAMKSALLEVYGQKIIEFSAKGTRAGSRPKISSKIYDAVYRWLKSKENLSKPLNDKAYLKEINRFAYNKRKYQAKLQGSKKKTSNIAGMTPGRSKGKKRVAPEADSESLKSSNVVDEEYEGESDVSAGSGITSSSKSPQSRFKRQRRSEKEEKENLSMPAGNSLTSSPSPASESESTPTIPAISQMSSAKNHWPYTETSHSNSHFNPQHQQQWCPEYPQFQFNSQGYTHQSADQYWSGGPFNPNLCYQNNMNGHGFGQSSNLNSHHPYQQHVQPFTPLQNMPTPYPQASTPSISSNSGYGTQHLNSTTYSKPSFSPSLNSDPVNQLMKPPASTQPLVPPVSSPGNGNQQVQPPPYTGAASSAAAHESGCGE